MQRLEARRDLGDGATLLFRHNMNIPLPKLIAIPNMFGNVTIINLTGIRWPIAWDSGRMRRESNGRLGPGLPVKASTSERSIG